MNKLEIKTPLTLFFSLPFYHASQKNLFYHGHISLGIEDKVYQIFNPYLLKSNFLVSIMPITEWLYNDGSCWVDRNKNSKTYTYVHLYKKAELKRTTVFYCGLNNIENKLISDVTRYFYKINENFVRGKLKYDFFNTNCTSLISQFFYQASWTRRNILDNIPAVFFKRVMADWKRKGFNYEYGKLSKESDANFRLHNFCLGLFSLDPMNHMSNWMEKFSS